MQGVEMPEALQNARPSLEPVKVNLGPNPAVFLAIDNLPPQHLSRHGFFFELSPDAESIRQALLTETWCLAGAEGDLGAQGILRPRRQNAGVRALEWLISEDAAAPEAPSEEIEVPPLPDGFYTGRLFAFPEVPASRRFLCRIPKGMDAAFSRIFGKAASQLLDRPRAWLRIAMPRRVADLHTGITSIWPHAVGASNVECFNETVRFEEHGASIPVSREGGTSKFLVAPLSVFGEAKSAYYPEFQPSPDPGAGRYSIHNGRIELRATRHSDNHYDSYANLRLWVTGGALGNGVGPGKVQAFLKRAGSPALRISNPTSAAGGADEEGLDQARARFAAALLSRDRVVTRADLLGVVRAFDRRILNADVAMGLERTGRGLQRVQRVRCVLDRNGFLDPEREGRVLAEELTGHLKDRFLYDIELALELEWQ
jgi:hypothetical protein